MIRSTWKPVRSALAAAVLLAPVLVAPWGVATAAAQAAADTAGDVLTPWDVARLESIRGAAISPDGSHVAYTLAVPRDPFDEDDGPAWRELHVLRLADGTSRPYITGEVSIGSARFTPDGTGISFVDERGDDEKPALYVIPLAGGEARRVLSHPTGVGDYAFSPDGRRIAFLATEEEDEEAKELEEKGFDAAVYEEQLRHVRLWIADVGADGTAGEPRLLSGVEGSGSELSWSPAGDRLALAIAPTPLVDDRYTSRRVRVVDAGSGEIVGRIDNPGKLGPVAWSPDGTHLAVIAAGDRHDPSAGRLMVVPASGDTVPADLLPGYMGEVQDVAWLDAETLVFVGHEGVEASLQRIGRDGSGHQAVVTAGEPIWRSFDLADGGGGAATLVADAPSHPAELYTWNAGAAAGAAVPVRRTNSNEWLADKRMARQDVVRWTARDGLELEGVLIRPLDEQPGRRYPLILSVHGGPEAHESDGWMTGYSDPGQVAAARGFAVFYPNYRGSTGYGVEFSKLSQADPAGKEFDDLVDAADHFIAAGLADAEKIGITGGSYGGYATAWSSTYYSDRFAAGVMFVGISDKIAKAGTTDIPWEEHEVHALAWPWEKWDLMLERSPVFYVERARTPLLILHGDSDPRVHPSQSMILHRFLKTLGQTPVRLVFYPGEGHGNARAASRLDYNLRMMRWFEHYLQGPGGEKPPPEIDPREPGRAEEDEAEAMEADEAPAETAAPPEPDTDPRSGPDVEPEIEEEVIEELESGTPGEPDPGSDP